MTHGSPDFRYLLRMSNGMNGDYQEYLIAVYGARYQGMVGKPAPISRRRKGAGQAADGEKAALAASSLGIAADPE